MANQRRTFGPLFYSTLVVGLLGMLVAVMLQLGTSSIANPGGSTADAEQKVIALIPKVTTGGLGRRVEAIHSLGEWLRGLAPIGDHKAIYERALSTLRGALHDPEAVVRAEAAETLASLGAWARPASDELVAALKADELEVRTAAACALLRIGGDVQKPALDVLATLVADPTLIGDRAALVTAMQQAGTSGQDAAAHALASLLASDDGAVRSDAARCIPLLGPGVERLVPALEPMLNAPDPARRFTAAMAAMQAYDAGLNPDPRVVAILAESIRDASSPLQQRQDALAVLYSFGPAGPGAIMGAMSVTFPAGSPKPAALRQCGRALAKQLEDKDVDVRLAAARLLQMIDPESLAGVDEEPESAHP